MTGRPCSVDDSDALDGADGSRSCSSTSRATSRFGWFHTQSCSQEGIHQHGAVFVTTGDKVTEQYYEKGIMKHVIVFGGISKCAQLKELCFCLAAPPRAPSQRPPDLRVWSAVPQP